ncbi:MAG: AbrB/MazE/SpoVT family DNA-binding domain-containing protein [Clostridiales bacterium]|nr:AbrB/MazE/SpoVT family DNA-binding domain-containing protein [Clostridiales bacterium]
MEKIPKGKYAWTVKVGEKGQFVIPKEAREVFDIKPGDTLLVLGDVKKGIAIPPRNMFTKMAEMIFEQENSDNDSSEE